jgi:hypothetical protein
MASIGIGFLGKPVAQLISRSSAVSPWVPSRSRWRSLLVTTLVVVEQAPKMFAISGPRQRPVAGGAPAVRRSALRYRRLTSMSNALVRLFGVRRASCGSRPPGI